MVERQKGKVVVVVRSGGGGGVLLPVLACRVPLIVVGHLLLPPPLSPSLPLLHLFAPGDTKGGGEPVCAVAHGFVGGKLCNCRQLKPNVLELQF